MHGRHPFFHHLAEHDKKAVRRPPLVKPVRHSLCAVAVHGDDEDFQVCHQDVLMSESVAVSRLLAHPADDAVQGFCRGVADGVERFAVEGVEHIVFYENVLRPVRSAHRVGAEPYYDTPALHRVVEEMHLAGRYEQQRVAHDVITSEIYRVKAAVGLKPYYLVEGVDVGNRVVHLVVEKVLRHVEQLDACAARRIAHHVVQLLNLMCPFHCIVWV